MDLTLQKLSGDHADQICQWMGSDRDLLIWGGPYFDFPLTVVQLKALIEQHVGSRPARECWAVVHDRHGFVGSFQLSFNIRSGGAGLGRVIVRPDMRGRGLSAELLRLACCQAFSRREIHRLELRVFSFNKSAISTYEKAGFAHEGTARQAVRFGLEYWDTMIMGLLRSEFEARS